MPGELAVHLARLRLELARRLKDARRPLDSAQAAAQRLGPVLGGFTAAEYLRA